MTKSGILQRIRDLLQEQFDRTVGAATEAHGYATDEDSRAESKYDTRGLEASYLAAGQAAKAEELAETIRIFGGLDFSDFDEGDVIGMGALVRVAAGGNESLLLLAPRGGGLTCECDGVMLTVLSPGAPLFEKLEGLRAGDPVPDSVMTVVSVS